MIIVIYGPPASGKSTVATEMAKRLEGAKVLTSDEFRRKTYSRFLREASLLAGKGKHLVLSGTFYRKAWRDEARRIASESGERVIFVRLRCSLETCLRRNRERASPVEEKAVRIIHAEFEEGDEDLSINTEVTEAGEAAEMIIKLLSGAEGSRGACPRKSF
ncbi:MAG: ATP-binding protein [Candidatus Hadarchaeales archaeon]